MAGPGYDPGPGDIANNCVQFDARCQQAIGELIDVALLFTGVVGVSRAVFAEGAEGALLGLGSLRPAPGVLRIGDLKLSAVPRGATGTPVRNGAGLEYQIPSGTAELSEKVASIRIMDPVTSGKYQYPNGYAVYMNTQGQRINPLTGQMVHEMSDIFAHISLK